VPDPNNGGPGDVEEQKGDDAAIILGSLVGMGLIVCGSFLYYANWKRSTMKTGGPQFDNPAFIDPDDVDYTFGADGGSSLIEPDFRSRGDFESLSLIEDDSFS
jgi:hypothetical protein